MFYIGIYYLPACFIFLFLYSIYSPLHSIHHHLHLRILEYELKTSLFIYLSITVRQFDVVEECFIITHYNDTCWLYNLIIESPVHLSLSLLLEYHITHLPFFLQFYQHFDVCHVFYPLAHLLLHHCFLSEHSNSPFKHFLLYSHWECPLNDYTLQQNFHSNQSLLLVIFVHIHIHATNLFHPSLFCSITPKLSPL